MDVATRFQPRAREASYLDREASGMPEDSSGESESNLIRRKFQRTTTDPTETSTTSDITFRKPSLPASATRPSLDRGSSLTQKRRSTLRENMRVPSGPREFPSPGKQRIASTSSTTTASTAEPTNNTTTRAFLPHTNSDSFFYNSQMASRTRLSFGKPINASTDDLLTSSPTTSSRVEGSGDNFDFLPDVNFDDFQTSIKNYDGTSPLLSDFPTVDGGRILPKEESYSMARSNGFASMATSTRGNANTMQSQEQEKSELSRTQSFRQRLNASRQNSGGLPTGPAKDNVAAVQSTNSSLRGRRQSSFPQTSATAATIPTGPSAKPPRKSVGPGLITSMMKTNSSQHASTASADSNLKPALARNSSLSKARRTTMQPSTSAGAEAGSRISTLTATTQSRQNKVKSLQPPPREPDLSTTPSKSQSKGNQNRAHTPSSSGNRRQSMASGRASGLGARTISPTDARRLKRMSIMNHPPMPTASLPKGTTPTPQDEMPNPLAANMSTTMRQPELPRLAQPSPSLIPRKTSNATPSSARASPEGRQGFGGGVSVLSAKSSFSSLIDRPANGSSSRLPTPKPRSAVQSSSSMAQYGDEGEPEEFVPPVPAIPKAYESPKDLEAPAFFSSSLKSSQSGFSDTSLHDSRFFEGTTIPSLPWTSQQTPRSSLDVPTSETPRKRSGEHVRPAHKRNSTLNSGSTTVPAPVAPPRTVRAQPDPNGRKNANLQPLRLPPLNLMPINTRGAQQVYSAGSNSINLPRPSQETDARDEFLLNYATPEPKRGAKTPSTPMTASKATFFRTLRSQEDAGGKALRSSSSHYALRDLMGMDSEGNLLTRYWDDGSDAEAAGVPIRYGGSKQSFNHQQQARNAITPFSSGSLPKASGEFAHLIGEDEYTLGSGYDNFAVQSSRPQGARVRAQTGGTINSIKTSLGAETPMSLESPVVEPPSHPDIKKEGTSDKKESAGGGLRRKLSLGWKRSSSKAANHADNKDKNSSPQTSEKSAERTERAKLQKQRGGEMLPPKLPASATWSGDVPLAGGARPSFDAGSGHARRKSQVPTSTSSVNLIPGQSDMESSTASIGTNSKTRSQHSEQPTPVTSSGTRASSWGNLGSSLRSNVTKQAPPAASANTRHKLTASTISAIIKDKDDFAADEEMQRLSRKRKDVDSAARESEELKKRALARSPVSAEHVLHDRRLSGGEVLNVFERGEIMDYEKDGIYFTGTKAARKIIGSLTSSPQPPQSSTSVDSKTAAGGSTNFGYDDERGDYNIILGDHLAYRYEVVDVLGKGSFGQVVRCVDHRDGGVVAIKIIRNKKRFHQQALVEVGILGRLRDWDPEGTHATLSITSSFYFRSHLCIVTPCLSINLYELIRSHNFQGFSIPLIRRFARQLLACLTLLQTKRIIHCDLKPENILLCEARKADVRVIDFGSSCREEEKVYTYIQSRFYRSPEVILGSSYGLGIDMWSLGCILAELWTGYPIFPGENEQEQLACIMEIFGPPDRHLVERCTRKKLFFDSVGKPRVTVSSKGRRRRPSSKTLQQALKTEDEAFVDFIARCLRWDPDRRLKPAEAVGHPFITNLPFHQRQGIPDEARRAARLRSTAAVPAASTTSSTNNTSTTGGGIPSPVKRGAVGSSGNAFAQQQQSAQTPVARERSRPLPETPQTALRNGAPAPSTSNGPLHGSPGKPSMATGNRRHSQITTAGTAAAMAGNKRASNGAVLSGGSIPSAPASAGSTQQQQRGASGSLAQMAARESMGAAGNNTSTAAVNSASAARWRT